MRAISRRHTTPRPMLRGGAGIYPIPTRSGTETAEREHGCASDATAGARAASRTTHLGRARANTRSQGRCEPMPAQTRSPGAAALQPSPAHIPSPGTTTPRTSPSPRSAVHRAPAAQYIHPPAFTSCKHDAPATANTSPVSEPPRIRPANATIDNLTVALGLAQQVANIVQKVPFIAPAAALMSELLKVYKEVKDTDEKREFLLVNIAELTRDLCGTILRMEATNHVELIGRLKTDIEAYAEWASAPASRFIKEYDNQGVGKHVAARNELRSKMTALNRELDSFGARFRTNRLVDLALNQRVNTRTLDRVHDMFLKAKLEEWLACPDMKQRQAETLELRHEGTGRWLLESNDFIQWQDNPGALWIRGPSGAGKSVLSSTIISELIEDKQGFKDLTNSYPPPAIAFFYFDFKNKQGQAVNSALRRIILQLSAQCPNPYKTLEEQFKLKSNGQTLPTYHDLQTILEALLLELGHTYIALDALDECQEGDQRRLVDFVSALRKWTPTPVHLLLTSQPRRIFTEAFADVTCIELESDLTQGDIRLFVESELQSLEPWANRAADRVVSKSKGMFRMAACLIVEISHCPWERELDKTLDNLPNDLFGIYDRFLQSIRPEHLPYAQAALRWLIFSRQKLTLAQLADAIAFDFSNPAHCIYEPSRREGNTVTIPRWLEGLATFTGYSVGLAHASVQDYLLSMRFTDKFGCDFSAGLSHTFIAQTCIGYLLYFADHPLGGEDELQSHPLAGYAADRWCYHLLHSHDRTVLLGGAMQLLEDGTEPYKVLKQASWSPHASPLHLCCEERYIEGVRRLLETGADINLRSRRGSPLQVASRRGHIKIVRLLLEKGGNVNATGGASGSALQAAAGEGHTEIVALLLKNGADVNANSGHAGTALQITSQNGNTKIVRLLLKNGADVNAKGEKDGTALQAAVKRDHIEIARLLLENGADVNAINGEQGTPLQAASRYGHTAIVCLLLDSGANVNATGRASGSALQAAAGEGHTEIVALLLKNGADVNANSGHNGTALQITSQNGDTKIAHLLLENGADVNAISGEQGTPLQAASRYGHTAIVCLLLDSGANVNATGGAAGSALQAAAEEGHTEIVALLLKNGADVNANSGHNGTALQTTSQNGDAKIVRLLLENGADVNATGGKDGTALQAAAKRDHIEIARLLLENGADVNATSGEQGTPLQAASWYGHTDIVRLLLENGADVNAGDGYSGSALPAVSGYGHTDIVHLLLENGADMTDILKARCGPPHRKAISRFYTFFLRTERMSTQWMDSMESSVAGRVRDVGDGSQSSVWAEYILSEANAYSDPVHETGGESLRRREAPPHSALTKATAPQDCVPRVRGAAEHLQDPLPLPCRSRPPPCTIALSPPVRAPHHTKPHRISRGGARISPTWAGADKAAQGTVRIGTLRAHEHRGMLHDDRHGHEAKGGEGKIQGEGKEGREDLDTSCPGAHRRRAARPRLASPRHNTQGTPAPHCTRPLALPRSRPQRGVDPRAGSHDAMHVQRCTPRSTAQHTDPPAFTPCKHDALAAASSTPISQRPRHPISPPRLPPGRARKAPRYTRETSTTARKPQRAQVRAAPPLGPHTSTAARGGLRTTSAPHPPPTTSSLPAATSSTPRPKPHEHGARCPPPSPRSTSTLHPRAPPPPDRAASWTTGEAPIATAEARIPETEIARCIARDHGARRAPGPQELRRMSKARAASDVRELTRASLTHRTRCEMALPHP
ncbi:hypothetical protein DFH09DRAFT_1440359 [Mycena vulgaris]|nr:hypothetical protein DFH09DRAFT_1440359 [Mycena vulgaris]